MIPVEEERELIDKVKDGDKKSFDSLESCNRDRVTSYIKSIAKDSLDYEEIYQKSLIKAWGNISKFRGDCRFSTWLCKISHNLAYDEFRKKSRRTISSYEELVEKGAIKEKQSNLDPSESLHLKELSNKIENGFKKLSAEHKQVLSLHLQKGMSYKDISNKLKLPQGTVMSRIFHAKKRVRKYLS